MNKVAGTTWLAIAVLVVVILVAYLLMR